ncbi:MAG: amidophosphoribosyltransferase [Candidatus Hodarchaeota archaeon]
MCDYKPHEACGVIGIYSNDPNRHVSKQVYDGLLAVQHRGQESAGIFTNVANRLSGYKALGLVNQVFNERILMGLFGSVAIGHVRYGTVGTNTIEGAQPFLFETHGNGNNFCLAFNGTLTNFIQLKKKYREQGHVFSTSTDTEVIAQIIAKNLIKTNDNFFKAMELAMQELNGSYSLVLLNDKNELYGMRDPLGFKPLGIGRIPDLDLEIIASESIAIEALDGDFHRNIEPGEIIKIDNSGITSKQVYKLPEHAFCMFEFVYFARPDSIFNGRCVYEVRERLGRNLARNFPVDADVVVPVPDSGRTAASGFSLESGIPLREGLMKNRYIHRTFIMPGQTYREIAVRYKMNPIRNLIAGKDLVLVDDSIVRGTTTKRIVRMLKKFGANKVHVRISCPPIMNSCYMGIDFPTTSELIAPQKTLEEIRQFIEADSLQYQTIDGLLDSISLPESELCTACISGRYKLRSSVDLKELEKSIHNQQALI